MAHRNEMRLMEAVVLQEDVSRVIEFLGRSGGFEFQFHKGGADVAVLPFRDLFDKLQAARSYLGMDDLTDYRDDSAFPLDEDVQQAESIVAAVDELREQEEALRAAEDDEPLSERAEALRILREQEEALRAAEDDEPLSERAEALRILREQEEALRAAREIEIQKKMAVLKEKLVETKGKDICRLLGRLSLGVNVQQVESCLESTEYAYRICGWISLRDAKKLADDLDALTKGRVAICLYRPDEVPTVASGQEKVPVRFKHNKFVKSFERMLFSYGAPKYGTIDVTPLLAFFFPLLFGLMFGDAGQGLVFLVTGILLSTNVIRRFPAWNKFGPIFIAMGCTSTIMGVLTGEFFANSQVLVPLSRYITGLYGEPHDHILHLVPSQDPIGTVFMFFGFTLVIGFIMNSLGLIINIINQISLGRPTKALFGKTGFCSALFFWYVVFVIIRSAVFKSSVTVVDLVVIGVSLLGACLGHPIERMIAGKKPIFEGGIGMGIFEAGLEIFEVVSGYLSNTVSFLRVGAFGLAHAVLGFVIFTMSQMVGGVGGLLISIIGNVIVIGLEGMIVSIQVARLHYYEFFSKFFSETGREFKPFRFEYKRAG